MASHDHISAQNRQDSSILGTTQHLKEDVAMPHSLQSPTAGAQMPLGFQSPDAKQSQMYPRSGLTVTASPRSVKGRPQPALLTAGPSQPTNIRQLPQTSTATKSPAQASQAGPGLTVTADVARPNPAGDRRQAKMGELQEPERWHQLQAANIDMARGESILQSDHCLCLAACTVFAALLHG